MKIKDRDKIFNEIKQEYINVFKDKLISINIYGSALTDAFEPATSDINVAIILENIKLKNLIIAKEIIKKLKKRRVTAPLFLSKNYIMSSLDTFPIEFLNIRSNHKTIHGEDIFEDLVIKKEHLRLQAERELKGKLLILRLAFLENIGNKKLVRQLVSTSLSSFIPVMKAIIIIKNEEIPENIFQVIDKIGEVLDIDVSIFYKAYDYKNKKIDYKNNQLINFFEDYINIVDKLSEIVDKL